MEVKKASKVDNEKNKGVYLMLGLVVALGIVFLAFEWKTKPAEISSLGTLEVMEVEEEVIPVTRVEEIKPPEPPPQTQITEINIVTNDTEIMSDMSMFDSEAGDDTFIEVAPIVQTVKEEKVVEEETQILNFAEEMPDFPGGYATMMKFLQDNLKYPPIAAENGISGKVYVGFVVERDGSITDVKVTRGVEASLDNEAVRVVKSMPKWKAGKQGGKPVRVSYSIPVNFILQ